MPIAIKWRSLRTRIVAWSFVPTAIILMAVAYVAFYAYQTAAEDLVIQNNQELARLSAGQLASGLNDYAALLDQIAQPLGRAGQDMASRRRVLEAAPTQAAVFDGGLVYLDNVGIVRESQPIRHEIAGQNWSDRSYYRQILRTRSTVFSDVTTDGTGGAQVVAILVPVIGPRGEFAGALSGMFRLDASAVSALYGGILKLRLDEPGTIRLVDSKGIVIYDSDRSLVGKDISAEPEVKQLLASGAGHLRTRDAAGHDIVAAFSPVSGTPWGLINSETREALLQPTAGYRRFLIFLLGLGLVAPALFVAFGVRQITRPIEELTTAAREVAEGNFEHAISTGTADELEDLAAQFNTMAARLQESYATLERRVEDRTRELRTLNTISNMVNSSLDLADIMENAVDEMMELTAIDAAVAYQLLERNPDDPNEPGPYLKLITYRGISDDTARAASHLLYNDSAASEAIDSQRPVIKQVTSYPESPLKDSVHRERVSAVVSVPLVAKNRGLGVINLGMRSPRVIAGDELSLLAGIGQQVGMAMENARLYEKAEEVAAAAERSRLARDLHDAVTQTLFSASLIAEVLPKLWERNPEEGMHRLGELRQLTRGALAEMRTLLLELRPSALTEAMLGDLLKQLGESVTGRARVPVTVSANGHRQLPPEVQLGLYRIAQEALNNVAKHAEAGRAWVRLNSRDSCVEMEIEDDGRGFDAKAVGADHLGIGIMRERANAIGAMLVIDSEPGAGTTLTVTWPAPNGVEQA